LSRSDAIGPRHWPRATPYSPNGSGYRSRPAGPASPRPCLSCWTPRGPRCRASGDRSCSSTTTAPWSATGDGRGPRNRGRQSWATPWPPPGSGAGSRRRSSGNSSKRAGRAGLRAVVAHTLAQENASSKVLDRCGFTRTDPWGPPSRIDDAVQAEAGFVLAHADGAPVGAPLRPGAVMLRCPSPGRNRAGSRSSRRGPGRGPAPGEIPVPCVRWRH